jgi:ABC-type multidrug transport system ATPase subunit
MFCIETEQLNYQFSAEQQILKDINLQVPEGSIYGFLGPNGAGKTTTLRLLLGLLRMQQGKISIFGKQLNQNRFSILKELGSLIESPSLYAHLSAYDNLEILRKVYQCPKGRIQHVLNLVGLKNTGSKKAGRFSLGMKQRLSIAIALLHQPRLLILDEPTNGLDPNGIIEMRELLKQLKKEESLTILISSHLLSEIEKLVTDVGIIHKGRLLFQGTLDALHQKQQQALLTYIDTNDNHLAAAFLKGVGIQADITNNIIALPTMGNSGIAQLNKMLVEQGIDVHQIHTVRNDLESIFMEIIKD